jgi:LysR family transcriptional regulator, low CO2-responsive transcriptional regulator
LERDRAGQRSLGEQPNAQGREEEVVKPPSVNLNQLITFYFVARCGSITSAAEQLCISQPAVSMQIKALETHLGSRLIRFHRRKAHLTSTGRAVLDRAEGLYNSAIGVEQLSCRGQGAASFGVGMAASLALHFFPFVERFKEMHPSVRVIVRDGPSLRIIEELLGFRLDLCIVARLDHAPKDLRVHRFVQQEQMVLVVSKASPLSGRTDVSWADLNGQPLIVHCEGSIVRKKVLAEFAERGIVPNIAAEIDNIEYMKQLIQQGAGAAFMLFDNVQNELSKEQLEIVPCSFGEVCLGVDVVTHREAELSPLCKDFLALVADQLESETI